MKYETKVCICGIKVSKSGKQFYRLFDSPKKRTKLTILSKEDAQECEFRSLFWENYETTKCFRGLLTFS